LATARLVGCLARFVDLGMVKFLSDRPVGGGSADTHDARPGGVEDCMPFRGS